MPAVAAKRQLRFELIARDWRGETRAVTAVTVLPRSAAKLRGGTRKLRVVERGNPKVRLYSARERLTRGLHVSGSALAGPRVGQRVKLHVDPQGGELERVRWSVVSGPRTLLRGAKTATREISFVVPRGRRTFVVEARAVVAGKRVRQRATVHVVGLLRPARTLARRGLTGGRRVVAAQTDGGAFCTLWGAADANDATAGTDDAPIVTADGARVTLGHASASGGDCTTDGARVTFTTATVRLGELVFEDVAGSVSADGIVFSSGWLDLPDGWWSDLPPRLRIVPPSVGSFAAPLDDRGDWGALRAQIALDDGVELLPLPEGWTFPRGQSTLAYVPAEQRFALRSVAQAAAGENGRVTLDGSIRLDGTTTVSVAADRLVVLHGVDDRTVALSGVGTLTTDPSAADDEQKADGDDAPADDAGEARSFAARAGPQRQSRPLPRAAATARSPAR